MKKTLFIFYLVNFYNCYSQELINPYADYDGDSTADLNFNKPTIIFAYNNVSSSGNYNGEYEILLDKFPWGNSDLIQDVQGNKLFDLNNFALSYQIELVSFPFSLDCSFPSNSDQDGGCFGMFDRTFTVPFDSLIHSTDNFWTYPVINNSFSNLLWNLTPLKRFNRLPGSKTFSDQSNPNSLVSTSFGRNAGISNDRTVLPHSILKHTINIHCGNDINGKIISSFSFLIDLTRGRMREYPFRSNVATDRNIRDHDLIIRPVSISTDLNVYSSFDNANCRYQNPKSGYTCFGLDDVEGLNINYTPFDPGSDDGCDFISFSSPDQNADYGDPAFVNDKMSRLPLKDYTLNISTCVRNFDGTTLAGYERYQNQDIMTKIPITPIVHKYYIDKNITLDGINHSELTIYNPSEVYITADNLKFSTNYTFKTIRGVFPYASEVDAANTPANGGPFSDPTKRDVPVETDLYKDFHVVDPQYPSNDHKFASIYHLLSGSKLTIEPCVKIFDATFEINPGSEIVFQDWSTNQINVQRYQLLFKGGIVTKRDQSFLMQNENETDKALNWEGGDYIAAGANVDVNKTAGEYTIENNAHVTFEATNYIDIKSGFYAKAESEFEASIKPVIIPPCGPMRIRNPRNINSADLNNTSGIGYFTVSPNPTIDNSYFMFEVFEKSNARIIIYDSMGKIIQQVGENSLLPSGKYSFKFQSENLSPGIYFAKLVTLDSQKSIKFIKQ